MFWGRATGLWAIDRADERRALEGVMSACLSMLGLEYEASAVRKICGLRKMEEFYDAREILFLPSPADKRATT